MPVAGPFRYGQTNKHGRPYRSHIRSAAADATRADVMQNVLLAARRRIALLLGANGNPDQQRRFHSFRRMQLSVGAAAAAAAAATEAMTTAEGNSGRMEVRTAGTAGDIEE